ncbi:hypothetical protein AK830_g8448 [Neonectria ditissima]|uniref:GST N-terminal domain-containing protein n=1 Tax=Neonectria ditissima TaxID=78410 RepID=A0A0N8H667_9HYPO|nr:hypothetical protein AK830_g8448 [Neonectria ditissima]
MAAPPPPGSAPVGPFVSSAPGIPPHSLPHPHQHQHPHAGVAQYSVAMEMGLDGFAPGLEDPYRSAAAVAHGLDAQVPQQAAFDRLPPHVPMAAPALLPGAGQFGILAPAHMPQPSDGMFGAAGSMVQPQQHQQQGQAVERSNGQLSSKLVVDPPELESWRERLFNVDEMIVLTHDEFETYFPHVDNVYSHRSTQKYKRKPFISHYWDCRLKGRPPGTPKSDDPNKKKRKRNARERDLCDVKIKITEYFPGAQLELDDDVPQGVFAPEPLNPLGSGVAGQRVWTIQRVNGNGGNGKGDGVAGPHKHTLAVSDGIKKNSVQRFLAQRDKETKKAQHASGKSPLHSPPPPKDGDKLTAPRTSPFSQRVWIALEAKGLAYQYCETDPFRRPAPAPLLEANPRGRVPAIRQGDWACAESGVILEYLEDLGQGVRLYPTDARLKANCRLWIDHINARIVPAFDALLQAADPTAQREASDGLQNAIEALGPFFLGETLSLVDIHFAPFALRLPRILASLRGWPPSVPGSRLARWSEALEADANVRATTSGSDLYIESIESLSRCSVGGGGNI